VKQHWAKDLVWISNIATPYRNVLWLALAKQLDLSLVFMARSESDRLWNPPEELESTNLDLKSRNLSFISTPIYINWLPLYRLQLWQITPAVYIDGWESPAFYINAWILKRKGTKVIFGYRSTTSSHRFKGPLVRSIRRYIFNLADYIVTSGSASTEAVLATGIAREKIVELFNPVDVEYFAQFASTHRPAQGIGHKFLFVGQLIERKNLLAAIKAFASIANPEDSFTIAGKGPLQPQIEKLIAELKLQRQVHLVGHKSQEELAELYAISHTLVMPSTNEVWGLVANEALATGMHAITSDVAGVSEFIKEMKGAYICTSEQSSIATKMSQSRQDYLGPIKDPEILKFTPEKFADEFIANLLNKSIV
jgi:glycosyltransferase involved in cell wall biosynthesis